MRTATLGHLSGGRIILPECDEGLMMVSVEYFRLEMLMVYNG
ncbi:MAG: hypothetical protein WAK48_32785 [Candidatus Acidiferrum sp.]